MKVLIVGVGSIGERHLRCFSAAGVSQLGICEVNADLRKTVAARYGIADLFASPEEATSAGFDLCVIATPAHTHIPIALEIASAGMHLLIEKPLATSLKGVAELSRTAHERRLVAGVAYVYRAHPMFVEFHRVVTSGEFGRPLQVTVVAGQNFPSFRPAYRNIYYNDRRTGGGAIQDALTHVVNYVEWLVGPVRRVMADAEHLKLEGVTVEDTAHALARHDGVLSSFALNQFQPANETTITLNCERGMLRLEPHCGRWRSLLEPNGRWTDHPLAPVDRDEPFMCQARAFLQAIAGGERPLCSLAEAAQTLRVNLGALESCERGEWVQISEQL